MAFETQVRPCTVRGGYSGFGRRVLRIVVSMGHIGNSAEIEWECWILRRREHGLRMIYVLRARWSLHTVDLFFLSVGVSFLPKVAAKGPW